MRCQRYAIMLCVVNKSHACRHICHALATRHITPCLYAYADTPAATPLPYTSYTLRLRCCYAYDVAADVFMPLFAADDDPYDMPLFMPLFFFFFR